MKEIDTLMRQLHDLKPENPDLQFSAAIALGKIKDASVKELILQALIQALSRDHQALTRAHAAEALGDFGNSQAIAALINALTDDYRLVRSYAARALGKIEDAEAIRAIESLIDRLKNDEFFGTRAEAAEALGKISKRCKDDVPNVAIIILAKQELEAHKNRELERLAREGEARVQRVIKEMDDSLDAISINLFNVSEEEQRRLYDKLGTHVDNVKKVREQIGRNLRLI